MLKVKLEPIEARNLKDVFIEKMERMIISGELPVGDKLPSERELAAMLGVSRPVVHEGLVEMHRRGFVEMLPRHGARVIDYRRSGSLAMLLSLFRYDEGNVSDDLLDSLLDTRFLVEVEVARLAALNRSDQDLEDLKEIHSRELSREWQPPRDVAMVDFEFHHQLAMCTRNRVYPMFMNSFRPIYINLAAKFFADSGASDDVYLLHEKMITAVEAKDADAAVRIMHETLVQGRDILKAMLLKPKGH